MNREDLVIECEYCKHRINENDTKCPHCGASVVAPIKEARKEREKKFEAQREEYKKEAKKVNRKMGLISAIIILVVVVAFVFFIYMLSSSFKRTDEKVKNIISTEFDEEEKDTKVTVGFNEGGETKDYIVTVDKYDNYEYLSSFEGYNTNVAKEGYQQAAFHLTVKNKKNEEIHPDLWMNISLLADGVQMKSSSTKPTTGFVKKTKLAKSFDELDCFEIAPTATAEGWVGFYVSTSAKKLEMKIGKNVTVEFDNPYYKK